MNFKLEKKTTNLTNQYIFKVDDMYFDTDYFKTDEEAIAWYKKYKEVYQPQEISDIIRHENLRLQRRKKVIVLNVVGTLEVKTQYIYAIWNGVVLENMDIQYSQEEHDDNYEDQLSLFFAFKADYNTPKSKPNPTNIEILFDENVIEESEIKNSIDKAHSKITRIKGKEYAPDVHEIQEFIDKNN